ncbi:MAG: prepilin-type N-terminal cleavage/methylation domain-containing protein [Deltaproteobacteria bacterium]|nr:prepilin-type N-terminal cleavage/methylation domain-containing protein [Deltaproteobacteria bacterium]
MFLGKKGYTFVELIVVIVMVGIVLTFAAPRLRHALLNDHLKATARKMIGIIHNLRNEAVREHQTVALYLDLNSNRFWTADASMTGGELDLARERGSALPADVRIRDVWINGEGKTVEGEARILFTPKGYTQMSAIHLRSEDGREMTLKLSPFMSKVSVLDTYVEFD